MTVDPQTRVRVYEIKRSYSPGITGQRVEHILHFTDTRNALIPELNGLCLPLSEPVFLAQHHDFGVPVGKLAESLLEENIRVVYARRNGTIISSFDLGNITSLLHFGLEEFFTVRGVEAPYATVEDALDKQRTDHARYQQRVAPIEQRFAQREAALAEEIQGLEQTKASLPRQKLAELERIGPAPTLDTFFSQLRAVKQ